MTAVTKIEGRGNERRGRESPAGTRLFLFVEEAPEPAVRAMEEGGRFSEHQGIAERPCTTATLFSSQ